MLSKKSGIIESANESVSVKNLTLGREFASLLSSCLKGLNLSSGLLC